MSEALVESLVAVRRLSGEIIEVFVRWGINCWMFLLDDKPDLGILKVAFPTSEGASDEPRTSR